MASTVRDTVERAYRLIGAVAHDEPMTADLGALGLGAFNDMLHAWALDGITLSPAFTDVVLNDPFPLADKYREGTAYLLAARLSPVFQVPFDADDFLRKVQASYMTIADTPLDSGLTGIGTRWVL